MEMRFEWDPEKAEANRQKHGVSFEQASELLSSGQDFLEIFDEAHSVEEERFIAIGPNREGAVLMVYTEVEEDTVRIISARIATNREKDLYRAHFQRLDG
jgi:uncharacterized DUF497 family protein